MAVRSSWCCRWLAKWLIVGVGLSVSLIAVSCTGIPTGTGWYCSDLSDRTIDETELNQWGGDPARCERAQAQCFEHATRYSDATAEDCGYQGAAWCFTYTNMMGEQDYHCSGSDNACNETREIDSPFWSNLSACTHHP